jgi:hypothetical protein
VLLEQVAMLLLQRRSQLLLLQRPEMPCDSSKNSDSTQVVASVCSGISTGGFSPSLTSSTDSSRNSPSA